ncbi:MAG: aspartate aminotransferase family protein [Verrucomicrobia bacterium]|nr:aspartate aminotransferase family protein [Verrucomicrobiota bacterium]MBR5737954.1 aspartate aminotransferase family protein [Verrucomicrobiota bacterium]
MSEKAEKIKQLFNDYVVPSYGRFDLVLDHAQGSYVWDADGKRYLDMGAGIAVCSLGHAHPELAATLAEQARKLIHISNLYYHEGQGRLAQEIVSRVGEGKCFFANSGGEANEGLYKLARKFGNETGRYEVITALHSFHGRTLAGIAATGQDKVKKGFDPIVEGFKYIPYNDLKAAEAAIGPKTAAILIEGIQGEGGITPADPEYLVGLRKLCTERNILLMMDEVQCGYYRSGSFCSFQEILRDHPEGKTFLPDVFSMAKGIASGFPMGAFWVRKPYADLLGPGSHATTFGGTPLACAVARKVLEVIERDHLAENVRKLGALMKKTVTELAVRYPNVIEKSRGMGFMQGFSLNVESPVFKKSTLTPSVQFVNALKENGVLTVPAGASVVRLLPPLNLSAQEAEEAMAKIEETAKEFNKI